MKVPACVRNNRSSGRPIIDSADDRMCFTLFRTLNSTHDCGWDNVHIVDYNISGFLRSITLVLFACHRHSVIDANITDTMKSISVESSEK